MNEEQFSRLLAQLQTKDDAIAEAQAKISELVAQVNELRLLPAQQSIAHGRVAKSDEEIRHDKYLNVYQNLMKCTDLKTYKHSLAINVDEWLKMLHGKIDCLATAIDILPSAIKTIEMVTMIRSKLDFAVQRECELKFKTYYPQEYKWETIDQEKLERLLIAQFGQKEPDLSSLLKTFGAQRYKKPPNVDVRNFHARWISQLPLCLKPVDNDAMLKFVDLVQRSIFYLSLDDNELQKKLSDIKESDQTLQVFVDEAIKAEATRKHYKEANEQSNILDSASGVSVSKFNSNSSYNGNGGARSKTPRSSQGAELSATSEIANNSKNNAKTSKSNVKNKPEHKKKHGKCWHCGNPGHMLYNCDKLALAYKEKQVNKASVDSSSDVMKCDVINVPKTFDTCFKAEFEHKHVRANTDPKVCAIDGALTSANIMAGVVLNNNFELKMEVDTAASQSLMSFSTFQQIVSECRKFNKSPPKLEQLSIIMRQADGTVSKQVKGYVFLNIKRADKPDISGDFKIIIVNNGPNNLLGRPVIKRLWPEMYGYLVNSTKKSFNALSPHVKAIKLQHSDSVCDGGQPPVGGAAVIHSHARDQSTADPPPGSKCSITAAARATVKRTRNSYVTPASASSNERKRIAATTDFKVATGSGRVPPPPAVRHVTTQHDDVRATTASEAPTMKTTPVQPRKRPIVPSGPKTQAFGENYCQQVCKQMFPDLLDGSLGLFKGEKANFKLIPGHEHLLKVMPMAKVPHGIKPQYDEKLDQMIEHCVPVDGRGIRVASQVIPVVKKDDKGVKIRLVGNYKQTINDHILDEPYQYVSINDQFTKLNGEYYTCLDFTKGYWQLAVGEGGELLILNTLKGFKQPTRMPFGVKTAPKIFQAAIDRLIQGMDGKGPIPGVVCVVDDICVTGATFEEHIDNLIELLTRLSDAGLRLNPDKCKFYQKNVKFLGKIVDKDGHRMDPANLEAITDMPAPTNRHTLRSFLGHMSYIQKHVADLRTARAPLDDLLKKDVKFVWEDKQVKAFNNCKALAASATILAHYDDKLPIVLTTDASPVGIGSCLSHRITDEKTGKSYLKPLSYASCSLKPSETRYAQIDREGLAVYWAIKHFRQFLYCKKFELHTDCSALTRIFGPKNDLGGCATGRLNRWAAALMEYDFTAKHIKGTENKLCDSLSRLPIPLKGSNVVTTPVQVGNSVSSEDLAINMSINCVTFEETDSVSGMMDIAECLSHLPGPKVEDITICKVIGNSTAHVWNMIPLKAKDIATATREDKVLGKLVLAIRTGEVNKNDIDLKPYVSVFDDLYIEHEVIFHGQRVVIPLKQRAILLDELHMTHIGIHAMRKVARSQFWWPGITVDIDNITKSCKGCNKYRRKPSPAPLCSWPFARRSMERVHIDFCEYKGKMLLVMIDAYSKFIWTHVMNSDTTTLKTLAVLYTWFTERGFPRTIVSDNGPQFTSKEFKDKMAKWGVKAILTPPYHPASNGLAEKAVGIVKDKLKKMDAPGNPLDLHIMVQTVLRYYRATPHSSTERTPYELIENAPTPLMFPQLVSTQTELSETRRHDIPKNKFGSARSFNIGDIVLVYDPVSKLNTHGFVTNEKSNNSYVVDMDGISKHISGDNMRIIQKVITKETDKDICDISSKDSDNAVLPINDASIEIDVSDVESVASDSSQFEFYNNANDPSTEELEQFIQLGLPPRRIMPGTV